MNNRAISARRENRMREPCLVNRPPKMLQTIAANVFQKLKIKDDWNNRNGYLIINFLPFLKKCLEMLRMHRNRKCCRWRQTLETWRKNWMSSEDSEENLETLQEYIDWCFDVIVMKKNQSACSPAKSETPSSKRSRPADSPETTSPTGKSFTDILDSIDKRLSSFDARLSLVEILHREFKSLRESLEFSQQQVETLAAETHHYGTRSSL